MQESQYWQSIDEWIVFVFLVTKETELLPFLELIYFMSCSSEIGECLLVNPPERAVSVQAVSRRYFKLFAIMNSNAKPHPTTPTTTHTHTHTHTHTNIHTPFAHLRKQFSFLAIRDISK